jgi:hypothetical protein
MVTSFRLPELLTSATRPIDFLRQQRGVCNFFHFPGFAIFASACCSGDNTARLLASQLHLYVASPPPGEFVEK